MLDELNRTFQDLKGRLELLGGSLNAPELEARLKEIDAQVGQEGFWDDPKSAQVLMQERRRIERTLDHYREMQEKADNLEEFFEMAKEDDSLVEEVEREMATFEAAMEKWQTERMLSGEDDHRNCLLEIHPGAGGTESQDWAEMLLRMYQRYADLEEFKAQLLDLQPGDDAGIKSATLSLTGDYAYGMLKGERGVHRLVRISPFDANKRRHTSFAAVDVIPEIDDEIEIDIDPSDLRVDTFRSSGAGGQHVNVTDSAVRITHIPSGIVVSCQNERSQHQNRDVAMRILQAKLYQKEQDRREEELAQKQGEKKKIEWGSQIRSYVLHPYQMVKDHRTGEETGNSSAVLDGDIDRFIKAFLLGKTAETS